MHLYQHHDAQLTSVQIGGGGGFFVLEERHIIYPT